MKKLILLFVSFAILKSYNDESRDLKMYTSKYYLIPFAIRLRIKKHHFENYKISMK
ncbi:hypothetical protein [Mammaliicoccus lentus]|uniref:hypothetical protein n=1 Tax=Mammaliicoccus lentus TaxID=42858 RepID=UPI000B0900BF|nr:hypothetical protein [Mammaliicoccus lentus]MBW0762707.1 hypothetical protein [Mammaliicoccus lentus]WQK49838.1 hypothetical protein P3U54_12600 [Mammaliicoccus lentus]